MNKNIKKITTLFLAICLFTSCANNQKENSNTQSDTTAVKKEIKKTPEEFGMELADAKCKKETAKNMGKPLEAKEWDEKMEMIKVEFDSKFGNDAQALEKADETYEYWKAKCPAMQRDKSSENIQEYSDSGSAY
jgi:hypothetical protein